MFMKYERHDISLTEMSVMGNDNITTFTKRYSNNSNQLF